MATCSICKEASDVVRLLKCPMCFKAVCERCAVRRYAHTFCSSACVRLFFHDPEN